MGEEKKGTTRLIRPVQARVLLGNIGNTTLWRWVKEQPDFPRPVRLSGRVTAFRLDELVAWRDGKREMEPPPSKPQPANLVKKPIPPQQQESELERLIGLVGRLLVVVERMADRLDACDG